MVEYKNNCTKCFHELDFCKCEELERLRSLKYKNHKIFEDECPKCGTINCKRGH